MAKVDVKKGLLGKLGFTATPEAAELDVVGTLADIMAEGVDRIRVSTKTPGVILFVGDVSQFIGFSKSLQKEVTSGAITTAQLGHCNVIKGENAQNEERYYLTLPSEYSGNIEASAFLDATAKVDAPKKVVNLGMIDLTKATM